MPCCLCFLHPRQQKVLELWRQSFHCDHLAQRDQDLLHSLCLGELLGSTVFCLLWRWPIFRHNTAMLLKIWSFATLLIDAIFAHFVNLLRSTDVLIRCEHSHFVSLLTHTLCQMSDFTNTTVKSVWCWGFVLNCDWEIQTRWSVHYARVAAVESRFYFTVSKKHLQQCEEY